MDRSAFYAGLLALDSVASQTTGGTFCDISRPIRLSAQAIDAMTDTEVTAALAQNRKGQRLCGWKP